MGIVSLRRAGDKEKSLSLMKHTEGSARKLLALYGETNGPFRECEKIENDCFFLKNPK